MKTQKAMKFRFFIELFPFLDVLLNFSRLFCLARTNASVQNTHFAPALL
jgi:hypothetical protein